MSFKLIPPFKKHPTPIVNMPMEDEVMGRADKRGNILINKDLNDQELIIYFKGKTYPRTSFDESDEKLPWEQPAYKNE